MNVLEMKNVNIRLGSRSLVQDANLVIPQGEFVGLLGVNGAGKSTLLKTVYGRQAYSGQIDLYGQSVQAYSLKEKAQKMAVLIQENSADFHFRVRDIVLLGRLPHQGLHVQDSEEDFDIVQHALRYVGMQDFSDRYFHTLSGGEKQRVLIARVLAQATDFLILDEPANHLDIQQQFKFFELISGLPVTTLAVLHDLNLAARFCTYWYVLHQGRIYAHGRPGDICTTELLQEVFGMETKIHWTEEKKIHIEFLQASQK